VDDNLGNEDLVRTALAGGERGSLAWSILVRRFGPAVWKALWTLRLSPEDREDAFQGTWLRALERLGNVREPAKLHVWLMVIARNEGLAVAERRRRLSLSDDVVDGRTDVDFTAGLERDERRSAARSAISQLPPEAQELLRLLSVDPPLTYAEIESVMGWPKGGASIRRSRAIDRLRSMSSIHNFRVEYGEGSRP
jgi:RNA polymerase sigma-70 factor (ECF subfamily)